MIQAAIGELKKMIANEDNQAELARREKELAQAEEELKAYASRMEPVIVAQIRKKKILSAREAIELLQKRIDSSTGFQKSLEEHLQTIEDSHRRFKNSRLELEASKAEIARLEKLGDQIFDEMMAMKPELEAGNRVTLQAAQSCYPDRKETAASFTARSSASAF